MSVRSLMVGGIPPLMLLTGLAMASAASMSVQRELARSASESALAGARAVSAFVAASEADGIPLEDPLHRLVGYGQILQVHVRPVDGGPERTATAPGWTSRALDGGPNPGAVAALARGEPWAGHIERIEGVAVARAFAPVDIPGETVVEVVMSVQPLVAAAEQLRPRFTAATAMFVVFGLVVALLSGNWLARGVEALEAQAKGVARGIPTASPPVHAVEELADLAVAFQTMTSVLENSVAQGRRSFRARPPAPALRARLLSGPEMTRLDLGLAGHRVTGHLVGRSEQGLFAGALGCADHGCAFVGRAGGVDAADRALEAAAARLFLEARLAAGYDPEEEARNVEGRFSTECLRLVVWAAEDHAHRRVHTLAPEAEHPLDVLEPFFSDRDQQAAGAAIGGALHDFGPGFLVLVRPLDARALRSMEVT